MYDCGARPDIVSCALGLKLETTKRYHRSWRKRDRAFHARYAAIQHVKERLPDFKQKTLESISRAYGIEHERLQAFVETPWGWYRLMKSFREGSVPDSGLFEDA